MSDATKPVDATWVPRPTAAGWWWHYGALDHEIAAQVRMTLVMLPEKNGVVWFPVGGGEFVLDSVEGLWCGPVEKPRVPDRGRVGVEVGGQGQA